MSGRQSKRLRRLAAKASQVALEQTPAWTFVAKLIRPKPRYLPMRVWRALLRWLFPGTVDPTLSSSSGNS